MWEKFTPSALAIIKSATREAKLSGHEAVDTSHLLFSLVRTRNTGVRAGQALQDCGLNAEAIYDELIAIRTGPSIDRKLPFAAEAEVVLKAAYQQAQQNHFTQIGGDQLLLGLLQSPETRAGRFLQDRGINLERAQSKLVELSLLDDLDFQLGREHAVYTPLARRCGSMLRRAFLQGVKISVAEAASHFQATHLLRGTLLGDNECTLFLRGMDYPVEQLYRSLEKQASRFTEATALPLTLQAGSGTIDLLRLMESEQQQLGDPALTTMHLLLALLRQTQSPLHDQILSLGDVNDLSYRKVNERVREQRRMTAE
ncbi:MAG: Clp protease N-terminal domain-containing protein [bacterium]